MDKEHLFTKAAPILEKIENAGYEAYYVGGSVRDFLLERPIHDVDIATSALPHEIKEIFPNTVDVGIEHGTILIIWHGEGYEITTFRTESDYNDFRHPDKVEFVRSLQEDLKRRDFTMNAIAMDRNGTIIDPFHGKEALSQKIIKAVGEAEERFSEDALRMMRAARFVSQLGFSLHKDTEIAMETLAPLLQHIAVERKTNEFEKLIEGNWKHKGLQLLLQTKQYKYLPGLEDKIQQLKEISTMDVSYLTKQQMWLLIVYKTAYHDAHVFLKQWRLPAKKMKYTNQCLHYLKQRISKNWSRYEIYEAGLQVSLDVEAVYSVLHKKNIQLDNIKKVYESLSIHDKKDLAVTGNDLKEWRKEKAGPWIKEWITMIEQAIIEGKVENEKESIREWLETCNQL